MPSLTAEGRQSAFITTAPCSEHWNVSANSGLYDILYAVIERLTVVFFIALCVLLGVYLILAPWDTLFGPWGENYLLVYLTDKAGAPVIARAVASNWFRGAVTGLGVLNLVIGFWEIAHFSQSVKMLQGEEKKIEN